MSDGTARKLREIDATSSHPKYVVIKTGRILPAVADLVEAADALKAAWDTAGSRSGRFVRALGNLFVALARLDKAVG